jgi:hypothetical protein
MLAYTLAFEIVQRRDAEQITLVLLLTYSLTEPPPNECIKKEPFKTTHTLLNKKPIKLIA